MKKMPVTNIIIGLLVIICVAVVAIAFNYFNNPPINNDVINKNSYYPYNDFMEFYHSCIKECPQDYPDYVNEKCLEDCVASSTKKFPELINEDFSDDSLMKNLDREKYSQESCIYYQCWTNVNNRNDLPPERRLVYSCVQDCLK